MCCSSFPMDWGDVYLAFGAIFWWICLPCGLAAMYVAVTRRLSVHVGSRTALLVVAVFLMVPVAWDGYHTVSDAIYPWMERWEYQRRVWHLDVPTRVAGLDIPAGSTIHLSRLTDPRKDRDHLTIKDIQGIDLPGPTRLMGALLEKRLTVGFGSFNGTLVGNQAVQGRPCAAGGISFTADGAFVGSTSSADGKLISRDE